VDQQGQAAAPGAGGQPLQAAVGEREPPHALGPGHQDVDEVVDHQGDLDGVDRFQPDHAG
jgi:hypothetical protein